MGTDSRGTQKPAEPDHQPVATGLPSPVRTGASRVPAEADGHLPTAAVAGMESQATVPDGGDDGELTGMVVAGRYRILRKLGEGGMGTVYLAEHITIEKKVALKVLLHDYARKQDLKDRFLQEARAAAKIGHENIVDITDFGDTPDGSVFFAMEFLEGADLSQLIRAEGPMSWARAKPILLQICRALGAAHSKSIIHRDMKPENIYLIEREGRRDFVKVLDFGIAKMSVEEGESRLTRTGMIFGTPEYMSPEQAQGNKPDYRVDIYAVGVIMYEMLTGCVPFKADTFMGILTKHIFEQPLSPSQMNPGVVIPIEAETIVLKAMAKERNERFQSMAEMAAAITSASGRMTRPTGDLLSVSSPRIVTPAEGRPAMTGSRTAPAQLTADLSELSPARSRGTLFAAIVLGLLVIAGSGGIAYWIRHSKKQDTDTTKGPARAMVSVMVKSNPTGAAVHKGTELLGTTPTALSLPSGASRVLLTLTLAGHEDGSIVLDPASGRTEELITLKPLARDVKEPPRQVAPPPEVPPNALPAPAKTTKISRPRRHEPKRVEPPKIERKTGEPVKVEPKLPEPPRQPKKEPKPHGDLIDPFK